METDTAISGGTGPSGGLAPNLLPLPPLVHGLPILGSALDMQKNLIPFLTKTYQRVGPIFRIRALNQELVIMAGPEANIFITQEGTDKFSSYEAWTPYGKEFGAETSMSNADGEQHVLLRKLFKPGFSANALMANIPMQVDIAQQMIDRVPVGKEFAVLSLIRPIVMEQLGRALANYSPSEHVDDLVKVVRAALNVHTVRQWPKFMLRLPGYQQAKRRYQQLGRSIVEQHRTIRIGDPGLAPDLLASGTRTKPDLVDTVLSASQQPEYQFVFNSEDAIVHMALAPFVAGLDTASNECTFALYALLKHPDIMAQCVQEADALFADGVPDINQLKNATALHHTMMETLRCYSIGPGVDRTAAKTFDFAGYRVEKGQRVFLASTVAHFLPELYADPLKFDITRYSEPRKEHKQKGAYAPFGIGTHLCLGAGAAEAQIMLVLASILHLVRLEQGNPRAKLAIKIDPTPTLGMQFKVRIAERRHRVKIDPQAVAQAVSHE